MIKRLEQQISDAVDSQRKADSVTTQSSYQGRRRIFFNAWKVFEKYAFQMPIGHDSLHLCYTATDIKKLLDGLAAERNALNNRITALSGESSSSSSEANAPIPAFQWPALRVFQVRHSKATGQAARVVQKMEKVLEAQRRKSCIMLVAHTLPGQFGLHTAKDIFDLFAYKESNSGHGETVSYTVDKVVGIVAARKAAITRLRSQLTELENRISLSLLPFCLREECS